jgi:hypothetical protein
LAASEPEACIAPLVTWGWNEARALAFGQWLSRQLGVDFHGIQEEGISAADITAPV